MATREDCICAPLDPEPDCPYHGNRTVTVPPVTVKAVCWVHGPYDLMRFLNCPHRSHKATDQHSGEGK